MMVCNSYWVLPIQCTVFVLLSAGESKASRDLVLWPISDFDPLGILKINHIKTLCNYEIISKIFKLADRMRSMRTNGASKNRDYSPSSCI